MRRFALASTRGGGRTTTMLVARACAVARGGGRSCCCCCGWRSALRVASVASARNRTIASAMPPSSSNPPSSSSSSLPPPIEPSSRSRIGGSSSSSRSSPPSGSRGLSSAGLGGGGSGSDDIADTDGERRLILIDGTALLYRCYFSLGAGGAGGGAKLTAQLTGQDTSVAHGFVSQILRLLELDPAPTHAAAVFDAPGKTFRHALYPEYKGHRPPSPPAVSAAAPMVRSLLRKALGLADLSAPGVEADDLIGTLAVRGVREGLRVAVVSPDKDFYQLLRPGLQLLRPVPPSSAAAASSSRGSPRSGSSSPLSVVTVAGLVPYTEATFLSEHEGLPPSRWADARALAGDPSDNVPGVAGIGSKTALSLVREFGSLEEAIERAAEIRRPSARAALQSEEGVRAARLSRRLLEIRTDLDLPPAALPWESLELRSPPEGGAARGEALGALRELDMEASAARLEGIWGEMEARRRLRAGLGGGGPLLLRPASELLAAGAKAPPTPQPQPQPPPSSPPSSRAAAA